MYLVRQALPCASGAKMFIRQLSVRLSLPIFATDYEGIQTKPRLTVKGDINLRVTHMLSLRFIVYTMETGFNWYIVIVLYLLSSQCFWQLALKYS